MSLFHLEQLTAKDGENTLLNAISTTVEPGDFIVIMGHNGSGKSTLLRHFNGIYQPDEGSIYYQGQSIKNQLRKVRKEVGLTFQNPAVQIIGTTVAEDLAFGVDPDNNTDLIAKYAEKYHLSHLLNQDPYSLSGGEQRRLSLAAIDITQPTTLLLDEPFSFLDYPGSQNLLLHLEQFKSAQKTVLLATHQLKPILPLCDRIWVLQNGSLIFDDSPQNLPQEHWVHQT